MATYPIPEYLQDSHDGDEWAIAAILGDRVVALRYIREAAPSIAAQLDSVFAEFILRQWLGTEPPELRELQVLGNVSAGIVTSDGFEERWELAEWRPANLGAYLSNGAGMASPELEQIANEMTGKSARVSISLLAASFGPDFEEEANAWALTKNMSFDFSNVAFGSVLLTR